MTTKSTQAWPAPDTLTNGSIVWNVVLAEDPTDMDRPRAVIACDSEAAARTLSNQINTAAAWISIE